MLVLERAVFPAPTVSCPIVHNNSLACLARLDLLAAVEAIRAPRIYRLGQDFGEFVLEAAFPAVAGREYAYSIRREVLDTAILRRLGTMVLPIVVALVTTAVVGLYKRWTK